MKDQLLFTLSVLKSQMGIHLGKIRSNIGAYKEFFPGDGLQAAFLPAGEYVYRVLNSPSQELQKMSEGKLILLALLAIMLDMHMVSMIYKTKQDIGLPPYLSHLFSILRVNPRVLYKDE
jgi:hypothetical protein